MDTWQIIMALLMGFSLAATCGFRAFLPLLIISIAAKADLVNLASGFDWMSSWTALSCFGIATILEILGDKIPAVDHVLDAAGTFVRPIAGAVAASSLISGMDPLMGLVIGIIVGGSIAGIIHSLKSGLRLLSTSTTGGTANPLLSFTEDAVAAGGGIAGLWIPLVTGIIAIVLVVLLVKRFRARSGAEKAKPTVSVPVSE